MTSSDLTPILTEKKFRRRYKKKPPDMQAKIRQATTQLRKDPRHNSLRTNKMQGHPGVYEARIDKANRLTFHWQGDTIVLRNHCNHTVLKNP